MDNGIFIALNGDEVGASIGQAISSDDHRTLSAIRQSIRQGNQLVEDWAQKNGAKEISLAGDEHFYQIPEEALSSLNEVRAGYQAATGHSLTAGIGSSMSQAAKALLYAKLTGKNKAIKYDPAIDKFLAGHSQEVNGPQKELEDADQDGRQALEPVSDANNNEVGSEGDGNESIDEGVAEGEGGNSEDSEGAFPPGQNDEASEKEEASEVDIESQPTIESEDDENAKDDAAADNNSFPAEDENSDDSDESDVNYTAAFEQGESNEDDDNQEEGDDLSDHIYNDMQSSSSSRDNEELKNQIADILASFKANKQALDYVKQANPELYKATIGMLQSMVEMAKKLGFGDQAEQQAEEQVAQQSEQQAQQQAPNEQLQIKEPQGIPQRNKISNLPTQTVKPVRQQRLPEGSVKEGRVKQKDANTQKMVWKPIAPKQKLKMSPEEIRQKKRIDKRKERLRGAKEPTAPKDIEVKPR